MVKSTPEPSPIDFQPANHRRSQKRSELIALELVNLIVDRDLPEGSRLPTEPEMVASFGVGRTTLREALRLLETRGVITIRSGPRGGPVVRYPKPEDLGASLSLIFQFSGASLGDVLEARSALEPILARLAAGRITEEQLADLEDTVTAMLASSDQASFLRENARFHSLIAAASGSTVLQVFCDALKSIADGAAVGVDYTERRRQGVAKAHTRIIEALKAGDGDLVGQSMEEHLAEAGDYWRKNYANLVARPVRWVT